MVFGSSDHLCCRGCFHVAVRAAFAGPNRTLDLGLSAESLRRSTVKAMPAPTRMTASVALKFPGTMQLVQVPMIVGASYTDPVSFVARPLDGAQTAGVNPLSFVWSDGQALTGGFRETQRE
jgi:hypothetical protein